MSDVSYRSHCPKELLAVGRYLEVSVDPPFRPYQEGGGKAAGGLTACRFKPARVSKGPPRHPSLTCRAGVIALKLEDRLNRQAVQRSVEIDSA